MPKPLVVREIVVDDAQSLIDLISPSHSRWNGYAYGDLAFRGQVGQHQLVPKAFRPNEESWIVVDPKEMPSKYLSTQIISEIEEVAGFIRLSDQAGLPLPPFEDILEIQAVVSGSGTAQLESSWPEQSHLQSLAIAQHHGVPTRLLDFSHAPMVAAYFCGLDGIKLLKNPITTINPESNADNTVAIWVIDLKAIRQLDQEAGKLRERISIVQVPTADNAFLRAQQALFLTDLGANDQWQQGLPNTLDEVILERITHGGSPDSPIWKFILPLDKSPELMRMLDDEGVNMATLMPSHDKITDAIKLKQSVRRLELNLAQQVEIETI